MTLPLDTVTSRICAPTGSMILTLGSNVYPLPLLNTLKPDTCPSVSTASRIAALLPSAVGGSM